MKDSNVPSSVVNVETNRLGYVSTIDGSELLHADTTPRPHLDRLSSDVIHQDKNDLSDLASKIAAADMTKNIFPEENLKETAVMNSGYRTVKQNSGLYAIKNPNETNPGFSYSRIIKLGADERCLQGVLSDQEIKDLVEYKVMEIAPFVPEKVSTLDGKKCLSYGLSSMGYDARLHEGVYFIKKDLDAKPIDPKNMSLDLQYTKAKLHTDETGTFVLVPPHTFVLGRTVETFKIPNFIIATVTSKSTYARCGIPTIATPIEPGFFGTITLEFINSTEHYNKLYIGEGVVQLLFHVGSVVEKDYTASGGKYNGQTDVRVAQV